MQESVAYELAQYVDEYLDQQLQGSEFTIDLAGSPVAEGQFLVRVALKCRLANYQRALSLVAAQLGEINALRIPSGAQGLVIVKEVPESPGEFAFRLSEIYLGQLFWNVEDFGEVEESEALIYYPGSENHSASTDLWIRTRSDFPPQVIFIGGYRAKYGAQKSVQRFINLESVGAVALTELSGVPQQSLSDFSGKYMLMVYPIET